MESNVNIKNNVKSNSYVLVPHNPSFQGTGLLLRYKECMIQADFYLTFPNQDVRKDLQTVEQAFFACSGMIRENGFGS